MSATRTGLARALSKLGFCSRAEAVRRIVAGRVQVNGQTCRNPERPTLIGQEELTVDGQRVVAEKRVYLMLNKPRGLVTTTQDERGRATVMDCFAGTSLPTVRPVGRLDQASEGLLLFTNDTQWAAAITEPQHGCRKVYHVQCDTVPSAEHLEQMKRGVQEGEDWLRVHRVELLRSGGKTAWLAITLSEGKNRHIRRMLKALGYEVLRLLRVSIGSLQLGELPKGQWRELTAEEVASL
jgi:23S rRNA pseudouridine2605 synthase